MFKKIIYEVKQQPVATIVSVVGTALAIFVVLVVMMLHQLDVMPIGPETERPNMLYLDRANFYDSNGNQAGIGQLTLKGGHELLDSLKGVKGLTLYGRYPQRKVVEVAGKGNVRRVKTKHADDAYWRLLDFKFIAGGPFEAEEIGSNMKLAILDESTAMHLFGTTDDVVGSEFLLDFEPFRVKGIVRDVTPFASRVYANVWLPTENEGNEWNHYMMGSLSAMLLLEPGVSIDDILPQIQAREAAISTRLAQSDRPVSYKVERVNDIEHDVIEYWKDGVTYESEARKRWMLYLVLLFVPAVNISVMTNSRLRRRTSEIGVRRAFGCTRFGVMKSVIVENMVFTFVGALIGLLLSIVFLKMFASLIYDGSVADGAWIPLSAVLDWRVLLWLLGVSVVLNLLSAIVPAWRAARMNPVTAINNQLN